MLDDFKQVSPIRFELNLNKLSINAFLFWIFLHSAFVCACVAITHGNVVLCLIFFSLKLFAWKKTFPKIQMAIFVLIYLDWNVFFFRMRKKCIRNWGRKNECRLQLISEHRFLKVALIGECRRCAHFYSHELSIE